VAVGDAGARCSLEVGCEKAADADGSYGVAGREGHHGVWRGGLWRQRRERFVDRGGLWGMVEGSLWSNPPVAN
jgi:hypothetical protein